MYVTIHSDFSKTLELLSIHEDLLIIRRKDTNMLLFQKVKSKQISPELANSFM